jgi:hypothetical protein
MTAFSSSSMVALLGRLALNLSFTSIVVLVVYRRLYRDRDYVFTYLLLNVMTFSLVYVLSTVPVGLGFAFGLFAIFGILRYRTEAIQVRDLTYLFIVLGIALLNALANGGISIAELLLINSVIVATVCVLETASFSRRQQTRRIRYDRLDLLRPDRSAELVADLRSRTHLPIDRFDVGDVDLLRDTVDITVHSTRPPRD